MKIILGETEMDLRFTSPAVEKIEDEFDMTIDDIFTEMKKLRAKTVNFMMWAFSGTTMELGEFKSLLGKHYDYNECIEMLTKVLTPPNEGSPENVDTEKM